MTDPYQTLGVARDADAAQIKAAFKALARKHHPDLNPGDAAAEARFKAIAAAHDLLSDPETRRRFDAGEIDASGAETPRQRYYRDFADAPGRAAGGAQGRAGADGFASAEEVDEFLRQAFGARRGGRDFQARGQDVAYGLTVGFLDAARGATREIVMPDGRALRVAIPAGSEDGQTIRLKGQGGPGLGGGPPGDAYVTLTVEPHPLFRRRDDDILVDLPVTLREAVLGGAVEVPTIDGPVSLRIPPGSSSGRVLRLRDRGAPNRRTGARGHQLVTLKVMLPEGEEPELAAFLGGWKPRSPDDPRKGLTP